MLDEIGEMSPAMQAKFLRVLEGHPFERVGGSKPIKVDVRVIAATNRDLERDVAEGRFRRDLYFRLRVLEIVVPALRKRPEDIPELADYFLESSTPKPAARSRLHRRGHGAADSYRWPGNVRELKNVVERAVVLCRGEYIESDDLMLRRSPPPATRASRSAVRAGFSPARWPTWSGSTSWPRFNHTSWNKSRTADHPGHRDARRWTARSAATAWKRGGRTAPRIDPLRGGRGWSSSHHRTGRHTFAQTLTLQLHNSSSYQTYFASYRRGIERFSFHRLALLEFTSGAM